MSAVGNDDQRASVHSHEFVVPLPPRARQRATLFEQPLVPGPVLVMTSSLPR